MNENGSSTNTTVGTPVEPHALNIQVANWNVEVATANSISMCDELAVRLSSEMPVIRMRVEPLLSQRRLALQQIGSRTESDTLEEGTDGNRLDWVRDALPLVMQAINRLKQKKPGATGLIPLGFLRDGGDVLLQYRVIIRDQLKGNRAAIFAQSGKGKTNTVKVVLFWLVFNDTYGKLVFDYKGEYVPWTQNERGENVPGLCEHPLAIDRVVLYTTKERHLNNAELRSKVTVRPLEIHLQSIAPRDFALFWPNLTSAQEEFLFTYDEDASVYETVLGDEKNWNRLGAWFGNVATQAKDDPGEAPLEASGKRVVRNIRKKLQAAKQRSYIIDSTAVTEETSDGKIVLDTPYNQRFVTRLKKIVPAECRTWDKEEKVWVVDAICRSAAERAVEEFFGTSREDSLSLIGKDLAAGKLVVVDFSGIVSEPDRDLIATLVLRRQFEYNLARIDLDEGPEGRVPLVVFFEEAQNLLGAHKVKDNKDSIFIRTFKEGRALGIGTTSVTQQPSALSRDLTSQIAYYLIQHLRSRDDIRDLLAMDPALQGTEPDIERRVPGNALYVDNDRNFPLPVKIDRFDEAFVTAVREAYESTCVQSSE